MSIASTATRELTRTEILTWLLAGDPALRWQTMADLMGTPPEAVEVEQRRVASQGWGAHLLARQAADGLWAGSLYSPKWTSTTYTLLLLHRLGLPSGDPHALMGCRRLWDGARFVDGGLTLVKTARCPETCITSMLVLLASSFGYQDERLHPTVEWLLGQQLPDGGWNCETLRTGSHHGSFHTSISVLEGLLQYQLSGGGIAVTEAMSTGQAFFLNHALYRSHRSGKVVHTSFTRFPFPPQWHYDVLRGLEHFRASRAPIDDALGDAVAVVRSRQRRDGRWPWQQPYPGRQWFPLEQPGPSRWATLRCLRVLDWWDGRQLPGV